MQCSSSDRNHPAEITALATRLLPIVDGDVAQLVQPAYRQAAVLIVLFETPGGTAFLLTERPPTLSRHPGQISLPGGAREARDRGLWDTALRETEEELGLRRDAIYPLGRLPEVQVRVSRYTMTPYVGWAPDLPALQPDPSEVAAVIHVSLASLLDPASIRTEAWDIRGARRPVTFYLFGHVPVWGATARVLSDLAARLGVPHPDPAPGWVGPAI